MARNKFVTLARVRRYELDQRRTELAVLLQRDQRFVERLEGYDRQEAAEIEMARENNQYGVALSNFLDLLRVRRARIFEERAQLDKLIREQQQRIRLQHIEVKRADRLVEMEEDRHQALVERAERAEEDEIGGVVQAGDYRLY